VIARDRRDRKSKTKNLPLINTDDADPEKPKPLKRGGTEAAEESKGFDHKGHEGTQRKNLPRIGADERG
jgi:hypothetical protein